MKRLAIALLTVTAMGCGSRDDGDSVPIRVPLNAANATMSQPAAPITSSVPLRWSEAPSARAASYGPSDGPPLLTISCEGLEQQAARLVIVRSAPADRGAEALFAIQGSKGILRLPVSAVNMGKQGYVWRGVLDAADPRAEVLLGASLKATVPGGGELDLLPMGAAGTVVSECVAAAAPAAVVQTLPNLAANPETSPVDR